MGKVSPDWEAIGRDYSSLDLETETKDYSRYFGKDAKNNLHNDLFNSLQRKGKKGDLHKYSIIKHYDDVLPGIQKKLIEEGKVVPYTRNGVQSFRSNNKWSLMEAEFLDSNVTKREDIPEVAKRLGRSEKSVYNKWREEEIKKGVWTFRKKNEVI